MSRKALLLLQRMSQWTS